MTKRPGVEKKHQKPSCESEALHFLLAPPCFGYRESVRRCRVFVVGPGLFVSLSVFVVSFRSLVVGGRCLLLGRRCLVVTCSLRLGRRAVLLDPVATAADELGIPVETQLGIFCRKKTPEALV